MQEYIEKSSIYSLDKHLLITYCVRYYSNRGPILIIMSIKIPNLMDFILYLEKRGTIGTSLKFLHIWPKRYVTKKTEIPKFIEHNDLDIISK